MNKKLIAGIAFLLLIPALFLYTNNKNNNSNNKAIKTANEFIDLLFTDPQKASTISLGRTRYNLATAKPSNDDNYKILRKKAEIIAATNQYKKIYIETEFEGNTGHNVVFYYLDLIKQNEKWKILSLTETEPILDKSNSKELDNENKVQIQNLFKEFAQETNTSLDIAEKHLISKAKKTHRASKRFFEDSNINTSINSVQIENTLYFSNKTAIVKISYDNDSNPMKVILSAFQTLKGWKIYDIKQI